ncbi:ComE operon protein 3 [bioreactor metagenome]|uniref:ComE operon protein 3 n=1 Tax=bioreactor metagenome TaxID=1076179 RepID=A0A645CBA6_9ZZZZ
MKKTILLLVSLFLCLLFAGCGNKTDNKAQGQTVAQEKMTVTVLDVGQADAILLQTEGKNILVDSGLSDNADKLVAELKKLGVKKVDILVATHPHADHIGGMNAVLKNFEIGKIYDSGQVTTSKMYQKYLKTVKEKKIPFALLRASDRIEFGSDGAVLEVLGPQEPLLKDTRSDVNANSIVMRLVYKNFAMMLAADATSETEARILQTFAKDKVRSQVLKVAHHTSKYSNTDAWLEAVKPEVAIASYSKENEYGFPHQVTLKRLSKVGAKYYNTADNGNVKVITDGESYQIKTDK